MIKRPKLVTVTGIRTNTLRQMLNHYKDIVGEMHLVAYQTEDRDNADSYNRALEIGKEFGCVIHQRKERVYNWEAVTKFYNEIKGLYPDDWWIVSDDDELQIYQTSVDYIIEDSDEHGYEFVTGGFLDKIGKDGVFPDVDEDTDLWEAFEYSSFFRHQISNADANKVTLMKGRIELTPGQHYAKIGEHTTWRWQGWNHPLRYPVSKNFTQVHHFKWDSSCGRRIREVSKIKESYAFADEYRLMYEHIRKNDGKIALKDFEEWTCKSEKNFIHYYQWKKLINKIINI